jgi:hypothetical protein
MPSKVSKVCEKRLGQPVGLVGEIDFEATEQPPTTTSAASFNSALADDSAEP